MASEHETPCAPSRGSAKAGKRGGARKHIRLTAAQRAECGGGPINKRWRTLFLEALAETSNVKLSAARAGVSPGHAYKVRREDAGFAAHWRAALHEGYENLEMEVLGYLRAEAPARKLDVANALRLLAAHRETVARQRALADDEDEQAVLDSIDAMIDQMRERAAANAAVLAGPDKGSTNDAG